MNYTVEVTRVVQCTRDICVEADSIEEAKCVALDAARYMDWDDINGEYIAGNVFERE